MRQSYLFSDLSTSAEPDAMDRSHRQGPVSMEAGGSTFSGSPRERAAISTSSGVDERNGAQAASRDTRVGTTVRPGVPAASVESTPDSSLPTATAEGSSTPTPNLGQRGVAGGAASSSSGDVHAERGQPDEIAPNALMSASQPGPLEIRLSKKHLLFQFFLANLGRKFSSYECHVRYGSGFRTRVSEINRDKDLAISINNETKTIEGQEHSYYWAALRG